MPNNRTSVLIVMLSVDLWFTSLRYLGIIRVLPKFVRKPHIVFPLGKLPAVVHIAKFQPQPR